MKDAIQFKIEEIQEKITKVTELIYQKKEQRMYREIDQLLGLLMELDAFTAEASRQGEELPFEIEEFKQILIEAMEAMEQKDMILFADILQDGLGELFQQALE